MPKRLAGGIAIALAIASLVLVAGCQAGGQSGGGPPQQSETARADGSSFYGEARVRETLDIYSQAIDDYCSVAGGGSIGCFQKTLLSSFAGQSAAAGRQCRLDMEYDPFFDCVMFGSTAERILGNLGEAAANQMDWSDPRGSFDTAIEMAAVRVTEKCPQAYQNCVGPETARALGLAPVAGERCATRGGHALGECLARALLIEQFETAIRSVGTVET
jgi:hypothetical protein